MSNNAVRAAVAAAATTPLLILGSGLASAAAPVPAAGIGPGEVLLLGVSPGEVWQCAGMSVGAPPFDTVDVVGLTSSTMTFAPNSTVYGACMGPQGPFVSPFSATSAP